MTINLGQSFFVHSVLFVQDLFKGFKPNQHNASLYQWTQNIELYIGNSSDYNNNSKCAGGPFMVLDDYTNSYTDGEYTAESVSGSFWNYGAEVWCNTEGQFVTIHADLSHYNGIAYE